MSLGSVLQEVEDHNRAIVVQQTWGHLAAERGEVYTGRIVYAVGCYGSDSHNPTALRASFEGLPNSPWEYDAVHRFLSHEDTPRAAGCVYEFVGTMCNYECKGTVRKVFDSYEGVE